MYVIGLLPPSGTWSGEEGEGERERLRVSKPARLVRVNAMKMSKRSQAKPKRMPQSRFSEGENCWRDILRDVARGVIHTYTHTYIYYAVYVCNIDLLAYRSSMSSA